MSFLLPCPNSLLWVLSRHIKLQTFNTGNSFKTFFHALWWLLLGIIAVSPPVHCSIFKIGLLGPWDCDPFFSKAFPHAAARLAVERISKDPSLDLGQRLDYVVLQEDCETSKALVRFIDFGKFSSAFVGPLNPGFCEVATLLGENWNKTIFSWTCINYKLDSTTHHPAFARTLPSPTQVLFTIMKYFNWAHVGIIASNQDVWMDTANKLASALRNEGLPVGIVTAMGKGEKGIEDTWNKIKKVGGIKSKCFECFESHSFSFYFFFLFLFFFLQGMACIVIHEHNLENEILKLFKSSRILSLTLTEPGFHVKECWAFCM